jgi:tRNA dimethylallyltransferase
VNSGVLILTGPTGSGKTDRAIELAEQFGAEIVGADSRQIYANMPIGTAAPTTEQLARVPHHLIGFLDPYERYSAARYVHDAQAAIVDIHARGRRAIVVGGTGFYLRALTGGVTLDRTVRPDLRARIAREARLHPPEVLHAWLATLAPERAAAIQPQDPYRIGRALEIALAVRFPSPSDREVDVLPDLRRLGVPFVLCYLEQEDGVLAERIARRVDAMLAEGLLEEAERIGSRAVAADAVGYREVLAYLGGLSTWTELRAQLIRATRRYAKRQATWFRSEVDLVRVASAGVASVARERLGWE